MSVSSTANRIFPILLINFVGTLGYSIILPFLVVLVLKFGGNELAYGVLGATYSFFQMLGAPILGNLSDKYGRKKILLVSQVGTLVGWAIFLAALFVPVLPMMSLQKDNTVLLTLNLPLILIFIARLVDGITGGNVSVANAYLADISTREDRKKNFGQMAASANLGVIFGPVLAGLLGATALGNLLPIVAAAIISLAAIFIIYYRLPNIAPTDITKPITPAIVNTFAGQEHKECYKLDVKETGVRKVLSMPHIPFMLVMYFLIFLAFNFFYVAFPLWAAVHLHWPVLRLGIFFSFLSAVLVIIQGPVLSRLSPIVSSAKLVIVGSVILSAAFVFFRSENIILIYCGALFFGVGNGLMWPSFLAILSNVGDDRYQGAIQGFASSAGSLASIIGLLTGAFLFNRFGANVFLLATFFMLVIAACSAALLSFDKIKK